MSYVCLIYRERSTDYGTFGNEFLCCLDVEHDHARDGIVIGHCITGNQAISRIGWLATQVFWTMWYAMVNPIVWGGHWTEAH